MNDGQSEFLIFAQVGAALGALCLVPVIVSRIVRRVRGTDLPAVAATGGGRTAWTKRELVDVLAPEPSERSRVRALEHEAIESRHANRRAEALRELRHVGSGESATTMLVAVFDPNDAVRSEAAEGIVALADPSTVEPLVHAIATRSRRADRARDALFGLGEVAVPELDRIVRTSRDAEMRQTATALAGALTADHRQTVPA